MESRVEKYYTETTELDSSSHSTRSNRNAKLYKEVYGKYEDLDNLPIEDNINEIDMEKLKELVLNSRSEKEEKEIRDNLNVLEQRKRRIDEQKLYDINKILEKAKYENNKLKQPGLEVAKVQRDMLFTLGSAELSLDKIRKAKEKEEANVLLNNNEEVVIETEESLSMTREIKYQNLLQEEDKREFLPQQGDENLSLDLFEDLKPSGNTIITKPIVDELKDSLIKSDFHSGDTSDIDIIKTDSKVVSNEFFTNSYEFSKKDFAEEDEFFDEPKKGGVFKIILLVLAITVFVGVIVYFVGTYGLGV